MHRQNENLTEAIKRAPHGEDNVYRFPLIGELAEPISQVPTAPAVEKKLAEPVAQLSIQPKPAGVERREFLKLAAVAGGAITLLAVLVIFKALTFVPAGGAVTLAALLAVCGVGVSLI
jgi:hypothetical protein